MSGTLRPDDIGAAGPLMAGPKMGGGKPSEPGSFPTEEAAELIDILGGAEFWKTKRFWSTVIPIVIFALAQLGIAVPAWVLLLLSAFGLYAVADGKRPIVWKLRK